MAKEQTSERKETCGKCKFFLTTVEGIPDECHYYPPVIVPTKGKFERHGFPCVEKNNFCGKFKNKDLKVGAVLR